MVLITLREDNEPYTVTARINRSQVHKQTYATKYEAIEQAKKLYYDFAPHPAYKMSVQVK